MRKNIFGRRLKRDTNERKALFKNLMTSLVIHERIQTTEEKAKAIKGSIEKLVTKAKKNGVLATPQLLPYLRGDAVKRMIADIAPRFIDRHGGYTRIIKIGRRFGDDASVVVMEWVEKSTRAQSSKSSKKGEKIEATTKIAASKSLKQPKKTNKKKEAEKGTKEAKSTKRLKRTKKEDHK